MNREIAEHFVDLVTRTLPKHADIVRADQDGDLRLVIDWRLGTDPRRTNKRSKSIELRISEEAISDYVNSDEQRRRSADANLTKHLKGKLASFDAEHKAPPEVVPPRERWIVSSGIINT